MSLFNIFKNQLSSVIEWKNQDTDVLWYKFPSTKDEIKNASKLIISPGQGCVLVYEGKIRDILIEEGIYNLKTDNHPFLTSLANFRQKFDSEHKLYIYFFRTSFILNQNWGTALPVKYLDPIYKIPVELGVNGTFSYKIIDPKHFYTQIVANEEFVKTAYIQDIIINNIPQEIVSILSNSQFSYNQIDANLKSLSEIIKNDINNTFEKLGLEISDFIILGTQFDEQTIKRIGSIADITSETTAAQEAGLSFAELEKLRALRDAAKNEGGLTGIGAQLGTGIEIGKQFNLAKDDLKSDLDNQDEDYVQKLQKINLLHQEGILTTEEFETLKKKIISKI